MQKCLTVMQSSTDGVYARVWQKIVRSPDPFVIKTKTAVEKVLNEPDRYIFLSDRSVLIVNSTFSRTHEVDNRVFFGFNWYCQ